jgi:hypothetical protein
VPLYLVTQKAREKRDHMRERVDKWRESEMKEIEDKMSERDRYVRKRR